MPTKKSTVKKTSAKKPVAKKPVAKVEPVMEHKCQCGENCHCHCHGASHVVKHIIVWAIIFALGMVCGKLIPCGHFHKHMPKMQPVFVDGCLDMESIKCPKMQEKLVAADINGDDCISVEEFREIKKGMHKNHHGMQDVQE